MADDAELFVKITDPALAAAWAANRANLDAMVERISAQLGARERNRVRFVVQTAFMLGWGVSRALGDRT